MGGRVAAHLSASSDVGAMVALAPVDGWVRSPRAIRAAPWTLNPIGLLLVLWNVSRARSTTTHQPDAATGPATSAYTSRTALLMKRSAVRSINHLVTKRA